MCNERHLSHLILNNPHLNTCVNDSVITGTVDVDTALNTCKWSGFWTLVGYSLVGLETDGLVCCQGQTIVEKTVGKCTQCQSKKGPK